MKERIQRVNELIRREISQILLKEGDFPPDILVTVTRVETSANLIQAKVWISVLPESKGKQVFKILNRQVYEIQQRINKKLKMRPVPKIIFREDKQIVKASRVEELLEQIEGGSETVSK
ncbi:MAG: ribosome-binding factor A [Candidatus Nealsonbacteria bacterium CG23_combo_of_CG06-09_8_20_14_all_38_19]|uniref:Ribosome-binding factor A n=1 Tax=Candidatus Nealsonbacteria bacterium CG23_combo_of_CG06-09_8_20_14_all_38_19 TaxID=1974721 RepID=A0A2G9YYC6_9BACT|nr:MAG: ribosome-binding factor A [Candidatus Nealsonbacteria bacterium CG23_combo_of_CG06-09_8_20_14_all_38_19]